MRASRVVAAWMSCMLLVFGCSGQDEPGAGSSTLATDAAPRTDGPFAGSEIGVDGGVVVGPAGSRLEVPEAAVEAPVVLSIEVAGEPSSFPEGLKAVGALYAIGPDGTTFLPPALLTLPYDVSAAPEDTEDGLTILTGPSPAGPWEALVTTAGDGALTAEVHHLSFFVPAVGCHPEGAGCFSSECCGGTWCDNIGTQKCLACFPEGKSCTGGSCCEPLHCVDGICKPCRKLDEVCTYDTDCCNSRVTRCDGTCRPGAGLGEACKDHWDCIYQSQLALHCVDGECREACGEPGEGCTQNADCCDGGGLQRCIDGKCVPCRDSGKICPKTGDCCQGLHCTDGVFKTGSCQGCIGLGQYCIGDIFCCEGACHPDRCMPCQPQPRYCKTGSECCSGLCKNHSCVPCNAGGQGPCIDPEKDCCPNLGFGCKNGLCEECIPVSESCLGKQADCCDGLYCEHREALFKCLYCVGDAPCQNSDQCCDSKQVCHKEKCTPCLNSKSESPCGPDAPCCEYHTCIAGKCESGACGDLSEACDEEHPCCNDNEENSLTCIDNVCVLTCLQTLMECPKADFECCDGLFCRSNDLGYQACLPECSASGLPCQDKKCCPGQYCDKDGFCIEGCKKKGACWPEFSDSPICCEGKTCFDNTCRTACKTDPDCGMCSTDKSVVMFGPCVEGACMFDQLKSCKASGKTCVGGKCAGECHPDTVEQSCPPKCDDDTGDLVKAVCIEGQCVYGSYGYPCSKDGKLCMGGACVDGCSKDDPGGGCPAACAKDGSEKVITQICEEGLCVPGEPIDCAAEGKVCASGTCATGCTPDTVHFVCPPVCDGDYVESSKCVDGGCVGGLYWNCEFDEMVCEGGECVEKCTEETLEEDCAPSMCSPDSTVAFEAVCEEGKCGFAPPEDCAAKGMICEDGECKPLCTEETLAKDCPPSCKGEVSYTAECSGTSCVYSEGPDCAASGNVCFGGECVPCGELGVACGKNKARCCNSDGLFCAGSVCSPCGGLGSPCGWSSDPPCCLSEGLVCGKDDKCVEVGVLTVTHDGLMWEAEMGSDEPTPLSDATKYCNGLELDGHTDWRVPTISELRSLVHGCAGTDAGGACPLSDSVTVWNTPMTSPACNGCTYKKGPGNDGCYWPAEIADPECDNRRFLSKTGVTGEGIDPDEVWTLKFTAATFQNWPGNGGTGQHRVRCVR